MSFSARASLVALLSLNVMGSALAADSVPLSTLAAASGYTYQWIASESGVTLQRPGVVIVLHAGYPLYEVNATPIQADSAPQFKNGDLVVSAALAQRLRRIAIAHPYMAQPSERPGSPASSDGSTKMPASGELTIHARSVPGRVALALSGTGPANIPITITLTSELSSDLPTVVLRSLTVMSAADGTYSVVTSIGPDTHPGTAIAATATSVSGVTSAVARIILDKPNPNLNSSLDQFPPK